ncbi:armadillo repeat-containing protein 7 isoform X3 [Eumetopias jubatus]|uniref:armadillo repeat-containing protein 7 isoform X3 n=1 Tax=Eumetopias jubatus TaxID=34886 RepID=UPI0010166465|nr:armadillo repeat-containing protein 7 isoform X3 [Eumetopias jubatus]
MAQKPKVDPHVGRLGYLQALVTEFQETESQDAKEQVLANLANFAYDPNNYQYLRQLQVLDLFLDSLSEENETLVEFAIGSHPGYYITFSRHILGSSGLCWFLKTYPFLDDIDGFQGMLVRRPLQPVPRQGQQGAHPADRGHPAHHQLSVQSQ